MPDYEFEEDIEPSWLTKQKEDTKLAEASYNKNEKVLYKDGDQVGNFLFVHYNKAKNRATFKCQECERKFTYNIYAITYLSTQLQKQEQKLLKH